MIRYNWCPFLPPYELSRVVLHHPHPMAVGGDRISFPPSLSEQGIRFLKVEFWNR